MAYVLIRQKVQDYNKWKSAYDANAARRATATSKGSRVFRSASDPNEVLVLMEVADLDAARRFAASPDQREVMQNAGVTDRPDAYFLNEVDSSAS